MTAQERPNKADQAYNQLEEMITFQELPPGSMLSEARLMQVTDLGRTPVREALQRLAREGMVEIHPSRGVFVSPITVEAQFKLLELRRPVEELAVRLAAQRADSDQRNEMYELADRFDQFEGVDLKAFGIYLKRTHRVTVRAAGNEYLLLAMAPLQGLSRRFWFAQLRDPADELSAAADLHRDALRAIGDGDADAASKVSLALNDYLVEFTYATLKRPRSHFRDDPHA